MVRSLYTGSSIPELLVLAVGSIRFEVLKNGLGGVQPFGPPRLGKHSSVRYSAIAFLSQIVDDVISSRRGISSVPPARDTRLDN